MRRAGAVAGAALAGFAAGAVITLALQGTAVIPETRPGATPTPAPSPFGLTEERPDTFLAWTPGGLPAGFAAEIAEVRSIRRAVVVASDNTWLTRSFDDDGVVVDDPPRTFSIPLEVAAVDPQEYAPFLPPADRSVTVALAEGQGVLGESSAKLRGLGPGATL
ncbi:MAG TPA: hypothetical protein VLA90_05255, partial [Actinomycetota bacterium]|nr:hypothetical protein [Actinomycetota bacterium]